MAKRFTATEKWNDPWFRTLSPTHKLAWQYVCDNCDIAGFIDVDRDLANFQIGDQVNWDTFAAEAAGRIAVLECRKWWVQGFVRFQYGADFPAGARLHDAVMKILGKYAPTERVIEDFLRSYITPKDKDKDIKKGGAGGKSRFVPPTVEEVDAYCQERRNGITGQEFVASYERVGWVVGRNRTPMKDWKAAVRTWEQNRKKHKPPSPAERIATADDLATWNAATGLSE